MTKENQVNLSKDETKLIRDTQEALAVSKKALRDISANMRKLAAINNDAGRHEAAAYAGELEADALAILASLMHAHVRASRGLVQCFEDGGNMTRGGGGGR